MCFYLEKEKLTKCIFSLLCTPTDMITDFNLEGRAIVLWENFFINCGSVTADKNRNFLSPESGPAVPF